jgi:hypothetical protein
MAIDETVAVGGGDRRQARLAVDDAGQPPDVVAAQDGLDFVGKEFTDRRGPPRESLLSAAQ